MSSSIDAENVKLSSASTWRGSDSFKAVMNNSTQLRSSKQTDSSNESESKTAY